ncbi:MAG: RNA-binding domain-containing protein, partial [Pseudolabrys sp.]
LNSSGGRLFIGVKNDGTLCGIEKDFAYCHDKNEDGWQHKLRDLIKSRFHEGDSINNYVDVEIVRADNLPIVRIRTARRSKLTFLKTKDDACHLYCRQGNRTIEVRIEHVEEFLQKRGVNQ